ncbi:MAG: YdbH domain-containing protein, partial [Sphingomonas sp.]
MPQSGVTSGVTAEESEAPVRRRYGWRWRRVRAIVLGLALILLVALIALWTQRKPIAADYIDTMLASHGVPARYKVAELGLDHQLLTDVVIGDPAHPDLVADWIELKLGVGLSGVSINSFSAGHVRMNARLVGGKLSMGAIDRLFPVSSGKPFTLPSFVADIEDARMRLVTPQGVVGLKLSGKGRLNDGFRGQLAAVSEHLDLGGCATGQVGGAMAIRIDKGAPTIEGPVQLASLTCGETLARGGGADTKIALSAALDRWTGRLRVGLSEVRHPQGSARDIGGLINFTGSALETSGDVDLRSGAARGPGLSASAMRLSGSVGFAGTGSHFAGKLQGSGTRVDGPALGRIAAYTNSAAGTPLAPLVRKLAGSLALAGRSFDIDSDLTARFGSGGGALSIASASLTAPTGATLSFAGADGVSYGWPGAGLRIDGILKTGGGGLPEARIALKQSAPGAPVTGIATVQPYAADGARLALTPVAFSATPGGLTQFTTHVMLSGPLGDGRVDNLALPISALWDGHARLQVNRACAPLSFDRLTVSGLTLRPARITLCPNEGALIRLEKGRLGGGARIGATQLNGTLGSTPITIALTSADLHLAGTNFGASGLGIRIGVPERITRLDFATLDGRLKNNVVEGSFAGGDGQIANVPLLLSAAEGTWALNGGKLGVNGALQVADADTQPRFKPLVAQNVSLTLADGTITTTGKLVQPAKRVGVADVVIVHDLGKGTGHADLSVPGITFGEHFQPDELTRLTFGVIANVAGIVTGGGHIRWNTQGVTSDGVFRTASTNLAAAFGPATGIAAEVRFTDLLNLQTAPGQIATIKSVNPGVAVNDGTIRYQLLGGTRVQIEEGRWPFAGGSLVLEPTLLDFDQSRERLMTFRVSGVNAGQFLQQFDFKNLNATGTFDGRLPMIFNQSGGRIENGQIVARKSQDGSGGGGTIAYVG